MFKELANLAQEINIKWGKEVEDPTMHQVIQEELVQCIAGLPIKHQHFYKIVVALQTLIL